MGDAEKIGVSEISQQEYLRYANIGFSFNIMVVGSNGLGKTAFINTLLGQPILTAQPFAESSGSRFWYTQDICNIQISKVLVIDCGVKARLTLIEVDGIGDCMDNRGCYGPAVQVIESRLEKYMNDSYTSVQQLVEDERVHVCFYFLTPKPTISDPDIDTMKHIAEYTSVIPVIGKSDIFHPEGIPEIGENLRQILHKHNIPIFEDRSRGLMAPFFVISGPTRNDAPLGEREYPWGSVNLFEDEKNDILRLRKFVFSEAGGNLLKETEFFYDRFRIARFAMKLIEDGEQEDNLHIHEKLERYNREIFEIRERIKQKRAALINLVETKISQE